MNELVSVIIPCFNRQRTIEKSMESVLQQTYKNLELIIVDDCSTDHTVPLVEAVEDRRVKLYKLEKNSGACIARNFGISKSNGRLIAFQDSDDVWHPDKLQKQIDYLTENRYEMVVCGFNKICNQIITQTKERKIPCDKVELWCQLMDGNFISTQTILCYKYCFEKIAFDPSLKRFQDWDLALQASLLFRIGYLNEKLVDVYIQNDSITKTENSYVYGMRLIRKHRQDIRFKNKRMMAQYYKSLAFFEREKEHRRAAYYYLKSFKNSKNVRMLAGSILCISGLVKYLDRYRR